jgi:hypothetical protein
MTSSFFPVKLGCAALAWLSLLVLSAALSEDPSLPANQLKSCYNRDFNWKPTLFNQFLRNEHCRSVLVARQFLCHCMQAAVILCLHS